MTGAPRRIEFEVVVDGEMPEADFDLIAEHVRRAIGEPGQSAAVGRSFTWHTMPERRDRDIHVSVLSRDRRTIIRVSEGLNRITGGLLGGIVGGAGGGSGGLLMGLAAALGKPILIIPFWGGTIGAAYITARSILVHKWRKRAAELRGLAESIAEQARQSITATRSRLPSGNRPRIGA